MKPPSFSKLKLADLCQFPWTSGLRGRFITSPAAAFGKAAHSMAECIAVFGDAPVGDISKLNGLDQAQNEKLINAYVELDDRLNYEAETDKWRETELCFGMQLHTGQMRRLEFGGNKRWRRRKDEVVGIIDLVREDGDGKLRIRDYKTGFGARWETPLESLQLMCYGLAATRLFGREEVTVELCSVGDELWVEPGEMDEFLLDWAWDELHRIQAKVLDRANNVPKPGAHCSELFCDVADQCPATKAAMIAIDAASEIKMPLTVKIESDDHARYILQRLPAMKRALKAVEDAIKERYTSTSLELADGKLLTHWEENRSKVSINDTSMQILNKHLDGGADNIVEKKISKTALKSTCKDVAPPRGGSALYRAIWSELEEAGVVTETTHLKFEARKRKDT